MKKIAFIVLLLIVYFFLTYTPKFFIYGSIIATLLILLLAKAIWKENWKTQVGIKMKKRDFYFSLILTIIVLVWSDILIQKIAFEQALSFTPFYSIKTKSDFFYFIDNLIYRIGQTLNEEMVLGGLLLLGLKNRLIKIHPLVISITISFLFSLLHILFYDISQIGNSEHRNLYLVTLISLFFIGVLRNNLILITGNISLASAIHFGWNMNMFNHFTRIPNSGNYISEVEIFNIFIGDLNTLTLVFCFSLVSTFILFRRR